MNMRVLLLLLGVGAGALLSPATAEACGSGLAWYCLPGFSAPAGRAIPANSPALAYTVFHRDPASARVDLTDAAGHPVPVEVRADPGHERHWLIVPQKPLVPGRHKLAHTGANCPPDRLTTDEFEVGAERPMPSTAGTVRAEPAALGEVDFEDYSGCRRWGEASMVRIAFTPSPELGPWLPLARFTVRVDGEVWAQSTYGSNRASTAFLNGKGQDALLAFSFCETPDNVRRGIGGNGQGGGLTRGRHQGELQVHIAGATSDPPPLPFEFSLDSCPMIAADGGAGDVGTDAATADAATAPVGGETGRSSGCSIGTSSGPAPLWLTVLVATVLLAHRRRRP